MNAWSTTIDHELNFTSTVAPSNDTETPWQMPFSTPLTGFLGFLAAVVSFITVGGNLLVITAFFVERQLRSATNYFIASLAITDLLIGMFSMNLYTLYLLLGKWPLGRIVCDLWLSLDYTACLTSQYTVFCITVDRFCSVKIPAKYRKWRSENKVRVMVAATWLLPAMLFAPPIFSWPYIASKTRKLTDCYAEFSEDIVYNTILTICYFWITLVVMIVLYIGIYRVALKLARKSEAKRRKVNNLMTMANQTAKVGMGVTQTQHQDQDASGSAAAAKADATSGGGGAAGKSSARKSLVARVMQGDAKKQKSSERKDRKKKDKKKAGKAARSHRAAKHAGASSDFNSTSRNDDDRSSSPALPSDSDNPPEQPNHKPAGGQKNLSTINSPVLVEAVPSHSTAAAGAATSATTAAAAAATAAATAATASSGVPRPQKLTASNDSDYHTASGISFDTEPNGVGVHFAVPLQRVCQEAKLQYSLCAPSDEFEGLRYIDEESIRSNPSIDSMRLLIDMLPKHAFISDSSCGSPIWKRRQSLVVSEENTPMQTRVDLDAIENDRIVTSVVEVTTDDSIEVMVGENEEARSKAGISLPSLASSLREATRRLRRRVAAKKQAGENKQSRTENRARKALKTITLILGAFVACWTPFHVLVMIRSFCKGNCVNAHLYNFSYWLCYMNSPINPFCYALANAQFKKTFLRIIRFDLRRR